MVEIYHIDVPVGICVWKRIDGSFRCYIHSSDTMSDITGTRESIIDRVAKELADDPFLNPIYRGFDVGDLFTGGIREIVVDGKKEKVPSGIRSMERKLGILLDEVEIAAFENELSSKLSKKQQ
jgi:hypothetical protein